MVAATAFLDSAEAAFERLFAQEYGRVASIAFRITRNAEDARDVAQEVFLRLPRSRVVSGNARGWLYQAAAHAALNAVRSRRRQSRREERAFFLHRPLEDEADGAADPQRVAERSAEAAMVRAALTRITFKEAKILALRYAGLSYREIAEALGVDAAQIGTRLARAERALKREIERETSR